MEASNPAASKDSAPSRGGVVRLVPLRESADAERPANAQAVGDPDGAVPSQQEASGAEAKETWRPPQLPTPSTPPEDDKMILVAVKFTEFVLNGSGQLVEKSLRKDRKLEALRLRRFDDLGDRPLLVADGRKDEKRKARSKKEQIEFELGQKVVLYQNVYLHGQLVLSAGTKGAIVKDDAKLETATTNRNHSDRPEVDKTLVATPSKPVSVKLRSSIVAAYYGGSSISEAREHHHDVTALVKELKEKRSWEVTGRSEAEGAEEKLRRSLHLSVSDGCFAKLPLPAGAEKNIFVQISNNAVDFTAIKLSVGMQLEALPGKSLQADGTDHYAPGDYGRIIRCHSDDEGEKIDILWERTDLQSTAATSDWTTHFKLISQADKLRRVQQEQRKKATALMYAAMREELAPTEEEKQHPLMKKWHEGMEETHLSFLTKDSKRVREYEGDVDVRQQAALKSVAEMLDHPDNKGWLPVKKPTAQFFVTLVPLDSAQDSAEDSSNKYAAAVAPEPEKSSETTSKRRWRLSTNKLVVRAGDRLMFSWAAYSMTLPQRGGGGPSLSTVRIKEVLDPKGSRGISDKIEITGSESSNPTSETECDWVVPEDVVGLTLRFSCSCSDDVLSIKVVSQTIYRIRTAAIFLVRVGVPILLTVVLALIAARVIQDNHFIAAIFDCQGVSTYCNTIGKLEEFFLKYSFFPLFCAILIMVCGIPTGIIVNLRPSPTLSSFGRGFSRLYVRNWRKVAAAAVLLPIMALLVDWRMNVELSQGMNDLLEILSRFTTAILDEAFTMLLSADRLITIVKQMEDVVDLSSVDTSVLNRIIGYEGDVRAYAQLGIDLVSTMVSARLTLDFIALLAVVLALSYGFTGLLRRSGESLSTSAWMSMVSLCLVFWLLAFNSFIFELWMDLFNTYVPNGNARLPPAGEQGLVVSLLGSCSGADDTFLPVGDLIKPFNETIGGLGKSLAQDGGQPGFSLSVAPTDITSESLQNYTMEVRQQVEVLVHWLGMMDVSEVDWNIRGYALDPVQLKDALDAGLPILGIIKDLLQCRQIKPFLKETLEVLDQEVLPPSRALVFAEQCLAVCLVVWIVLAYWLKYLFSRPEKKFYDPASNRWFRFQASYRVARLHRMKVPRDCEPRVEDRFLCTWAEFLQGVLLLDTVMVSWLFITACMLLWFGGDLDPNRNLVVWGCVLLVMSSLVAVAGSWSELERCHNRALRAFAAVLVAGATAILAYACSANVMRAKSCWEKVGYNPMVDGPSASMAHKKTSAETAADWTLGLTGPGLNDGDRVVAVKDLTSCPPALQERPQPLGEVPEEALSERATSFGRSYAFLDHPLESGTYGICWCPAQTGCRETGSYDKFSGHIYVDMEPDQFETCSLEALVGMAQSATMVAFLFVPLLLRIILGLATLVKAVYSSHITDRMRKAMVSNGTVKVVDFFKRKGLFEVAAVQMPWSVRRNIFVIVDKDEEDLDGEGKIEIEHLRESVVGTEFEDQIADFIIVPDLPDKDDKGDKRSGALQYKKALRQIVDDHLHSQFGGCAPTGMLGCCESSKWEMIQMVCGFHLRSTSQNQVVAADQESDVGSPDARTRMLGAGAEGDSRRTTSRCTWPDWSHPIAFLLLVLLLVGVVVTVDKSEGEDGKCYSGRGCGPRPSTTPRPPPQPPATVTSCPTCCNLQEATCNLRVHEAAFAQAHNAMSSEEMKWLFPNNVWDMPRALDRGLRSLSIDLWYRDFGDATGVDVVPYANLCHGACGIGHSSLEDELAKIKQWLDDNPRELIIFVLEQYVDSVNVIRAFQSSGLSQYCGYGHPSPSQPWPTIGELIAQNSRVLVFSNRPKNWVIGPDMKQKLEVYHNYLGASWVNEVNSVTWWHDKSEFFANTHWTNTDLDAMVADCSLGEDYPDGSAFAPGGAHEYRLVEVNHFMSVPLPCKRCAYSANAVSTLQQRYDNCRPQWGMHQANFVVVDFWSIGGVVASAKSLNDPNFDPDTSYYTGAYSVIYDDDAPPDDDWPEPDSTCTGRHCNMSMQLGPNAPPTRVL